MAGSSALLNTSLGTNSVPADNAPPKERIPTALKTLIATIAAAVAAIFGFLLAGSLGAIISALPVGAMVWVAVSCITSREEADPEVQRTQNTAREVIRQQPADRVQDVEADGNVGHKISQFHHDHGILFYENEKLLSNPAQLIEVDVDQLGLDLELEEPECIRRDGVVEPPVRMREVAECVVAEINRVIQFRKKPYRAARATRRFNLNSGDRDSPLYRYKACGAALAPPDEPFSIKDLWIRKIIDALVHKGHLFRLMEHSDVYVYDIQA